MCTIGGGPVAPGAIEDTLADELLLALGVCEVHLQELLGAGESEPAAVYRRDGGECTRLPYTVDGVPLSPAVDSMLTSGLPYLGDAAMLAPEVRTRAGASDRAASFHWPSTAAPACW